MDESISDLPLCEPGVVRLQRCLKTIYPDGNCLFRANSYFIFLNEKFHSSIREKIVDHVVENWENEYAGFIIGSGIYPKPLNDAPTYKRYMIEDKIWGAQVELIAATKVYNICFQIFDARDHTYYRMGDERNTIYALHFSGNDHVAHYNVIEDVPLPCVDTPKSLKTKKKLTKKRPKVNPYNLVGTNNGVKRLNGQLGRKRTSPRVETEIL